MKHQHHLALVPLLTLAMLSHAAQPGTPQPGLPGSANVLLPSVQQAPALLGLTLPTQTIAPDTNVSLPLNLSARGQGAQCWLHISVFKLAGDRIGTKVSEQWSQTALPNNNLVAALPGLATGEYRIELAATTGCTGVVSAYFEAKRQSLGVASIAPSMQRAGINFNATDKSLTIDLAGTPGQCAYQVDVHSNATNRTYSKVGTGSMPLKDTIALNGAMFMSDSLPYGGYDVTVKAPPQGAIADPRTLPCLGTFQQSFEVQRPKLALASPVIDGFSLRLVGDAGATTLSADRMQINRDHVKSLMLNVSTRNSEAAPNGCGYSVRVDFAKQLLANSKQDVDLWSMLKSANNTGSFDITLAASDLNLNTATPACLGSKTFKLEITEDLAGVGTIPATKPDTWATVEHLDSLPIGLEALDLFVPYFIISYGGPYAVERVHIKPNIQGFPCKYSISLQAPGEAAKLRTGLVHVSNGADNIAFVTYRGPDSADAFAKLGAQYASKKYSLVIEASANDKKGNGVACKGSYRDDNFVIPVAMF